MASARPLSTFGADGRAGGSAAGHGNALDGAFSTRFTSVKAVPASASLGFASPGMASSSSLTQCVATTTRAMLGIDLRCGTARRLFEWRVGGQAGSDGGGFGDLLAGAAFGGGGVVNEFDASVGGSRLGDFGSLTACGVGFGSWRAAGGAGGKVRCASVWRFVGSVCTACPCARLCTGRCSLRFTYRHFASLAFSRSASIMICTAPAARSPRRAGLRAAVPRARLRFSTR